MASLNTEKHPNGFTLIELLFIVVISGILSVFVYDSFGTGAQRNQVVRRASAEFVSNVRRAQSLAVSSKNLKDEVTQRQYCGYGIHYLNATSYSIYKSWDEGGSCAFSDHRYAVANDIVYQSFVLVDSHAQFNAPFLDIFFEPPDPKVYLNNDANLSLPPQASTICYKGATECKSVLVYTSGRIEIQ